MNRFPVVAKRRRASPNNSPEGTSRSPETAMEFMQWWRDAINGEDKFLLEEDDIFRGSHFGEPYLYVRLASKDDTGAVPFLEVARRLYQCGTGAMVCRRGWSPEQTHNLDCLWLAYGDIVDFLLSGEIVERENATLGWGAPIDWEGIRLGPPGSDVLPGHQRTVLFLAMQSMGIGAPKVVLLTDRRGTRCLAFNIHSYIEDYEEAMTASAFINWFMPRHYLQAVFEDDYRIAIFPVLPEETELFADKYSPPPNPDDPWDEYKRQSARTNALLNADAIPMKGERRWRERALSPEIRFHVDFDNIITSQEGTPHIIWRVVTYQDQESCTFREAALATADQLCGAILCDPDWQFDEEQDEQEADAARLVLRLGDLVDYLMTGELVRRRFASEGWLYPMEYYTGCFSEPDTLLLPMQSRNAITMAMNLAGVMKPHVALQTLNKGQRLLHFSGHDVVGQDPVRRANLLTQIHWCLPRHYTPMLLNSTTHLAWSLQPTSTIPDARVIDLDHDEDEELEDETE